MPKYRKKPVTTDPYLEKIYMDSFLKVGLLVLEAERVPCKPDIFEQDYEPADQFFADEPTCPNGLVFEQTYEKVE